MYHEIIRKNIPYLYKLSWDNNNPAIIIKLHQETVSKFPNISSEAPIIKAYMKEFELKNFSGSVDADFGFEKVLKLIDKRKNDVIFRAEIPQVKEFFDEPCDSCGGSGKDRDDNTRECFSCNGNGHNYELEWDRAYKLCASLSVLFTPLAFQDINTHDKSHQLIIVDTAIAKSMSGAGVYGYYSVPLVNYLRSLTSRTSIDGMANAMKEAHVKIYQSMGFYKDYGFRASVDYENGWLNVSCPGDACGLHPANSGGWDKDEGYQFSCHNVDSPMQQLTLLAGLAGLCDTVREYIDT